MIPQHYVIEAGALLAGEYPGDPEPEAARERIAGLVEMGVRTFVDLTSRADGMASYDEVLRELERETGLVLRRISLPVPDMDVPESTETMRRILDALGTAERAVYFHCWGGIGRTGTVAGCWLRERGLDGEAALARVQELYAENMEKVTRHPRSPQTRGQMEYVKGWGR